MKKKTLPREAGVMLHLSILFHSTTIFGAMAFIFSYNTIKGIQASYERRYPVVTTFAYFGYELPMKKRLDLIKQAGFDGAMLWWSDDFANADYRSAPAMARKIGLYVENIHTPFDHINNLWFDNLDGNTLTNNFLRMIDDCAEYDIPTMVVHLSSGDNPPPLNRLGLERIKRIVEKAEERNINIAFENLRRHEYLEYILDNIVSPRAGFCYDSGHQHCRTLHVDLLSLYGPRLMALHLHDNDGYISGAGAEDQHHLPFEGTIDWAVVMGKIAQSGYTGPVALEAVNKRPEDMPPEVFLQLAYERAKKLEDLLHREI